jgi:hypothetical protein
MKWFRTNLKEKEDTPPVQESVTRGLLIFAHPTTVISVEELLKDEGYKIRVVSPPTQYRTGCDLCVEFPLAEESTITKLLITTGLGTLTVCQEKGLWPIPDG